MIVKIVMKREVFNSFSTACLSYPKSLESHTLYEAQLVLKIASTLNFVTESCCKIWEIYQYGKIMHICLIRLAIIHIPIVSGRINI